MTGVDVWWVYLALQNIPYATVLSLGNNIVLYCIVSLYCSWLYNAYKWKFVFGTSVQEATLKINNYMDAEITFFFLWESKGIERCFLPDWFRFNNIKLSDCFAYYKNVSFQFLSQEFHNVRYSAILCSRADPLRSSRMRL